MEQREVQVLQREATFVQEIRARNFRFILNIYQDLHLEEYSHDDTRKLLHHMSKATTASEDLYCQNQAALKGYTRQKFVERARLVADSIARIHFVATCHSQTTEAEVPWSSLFTNTCQVFSKQLHSIQSIASIGCGPGSDLTGAIATTLTSVRNIVALDSSMNEWEFIVKDVLVQITKNTSTNLFITNCDIRIDPAGNDTAAGTGLDQVVACGFNLLIVISYVLCETRGGWYAWMDCLVERCAVRTMWLVLEPTAWQLHIFRTRYQHVMDFVWLDTSMYREDLQELETRNGPAVLLCRKKDKCVDE